MTERKDTYDEGIVFTYHAGSAEDIAKYAAIRSDAKDFALRLRQLCPPGRELALARTKLEECVMWANAGIARARARRGSS